MSRRQAAPTSSTHALLARSAAVVWSATTRVSSDVLTPCIRSCRDLASVLGHDRIVAYCTSVSKEGTCPGTWGCIDFMISPLHLPTSGQPHRSVPGSSPLKYRFPSLVCSVFSTFFSQCVLCRKCCVSSKAEPAVPSTTAAMSAWFASMGVS